LGQGIINDEPFGQTNPGLHLTQIGGQILAESVTMLSPAAQSGQLGPITERLELTCVCRVYCPLIPEVEKQTRKEPGFTFCGKFTIAQVIFVGHIVEQGSGTIREKFEQTDCEVGMNATYDNREQSAPRTKSIRVF
jgi:hypothetical protein